MKRAVHAVIDTPIYHGEYRNRLSKTRLLDKMTLRQREHKG